MIVATAGHIDHGKTSLVKALTGVDTDRLPEEKARGMSIDIGIAYLDLGGGQTIGFIDVPGHERFVRNMLSGVYAIDHVLLLIAADDGVMPQTREHLQIVSLLGVTEGTVVITKKDRVDTERLLEVEREARDLLRSVGLSSFPLMAVSSVTGDGVPALGQRLRAAASERHVAADADQFPRFVIDRGFTVPGAGTVVTGTVVSGSIRAGDTLVVSPEGVRGRARKLQRHGQDTDRATTGERCAINLANVEQNEIGRGNWLVASAAHHPTDRMDVRLRVPASASEPLKHWTPVHLHIGAADVLARVTLRRGSSIKPGEDAFARLRLQQPIHAVHRDRFILRNESATRTVAGGVVIDPLPPLRRGRADRKPILAALDGGDADTAVSALLAAAAESVFEMEWLARIFNRPLDAMLRHVPADATVITTPAAHIVFSAHKVALLKGAVVERTKQFHAQQPDAVGIDLARLHRETARSLDGDAFSGLLKLRSEAWGLVVQGSRIRVASHDSTANPQDAQLWKRVRGRLEELAFAIPSVRELSAWSGVPLQQVRDLMHRKSTNGDLIKLTLERFALRETLEALGDEAMETARRSADGQFTAAEFRDRIGTGRGLAIEILECLDKRGLTVRRGNSRVVRAQSGVTAPALPKSGASAPQR